MSNVARKPDTNNGRDLAREIQAAKELRAQILALHDGDEEFARDVIEGETSIREVIADLVADDAQDAATVEGIEHLKDHLNARSERIRRRADLRRALILQGLTAAGLDKLETPAGTVSVKNVPPSAIVTEEADIPAQFWKQTAPKLDKRALLAALKDGAVPGATLSNGGQTIGVRR